MNQQRQRRFRTALDARKAREGAIEKGEEVPDASTVFDSNWLVILFQRSSFFLFFFLFVCVLFVCLFVCLFVILFFETLSFLVWSFSFWCSFICQQKEQNKTKQNKIEIAHKNNLI